MVEFQFPVRKNDGITHIDLGRPDEGNSLTRGMMRALAETIRNASSETDARVLVLSGRGPQFCRGRDGRGETNEGLSPYDIRVQMMGPVLGVYAAINASPIPVVARVHGAALGFGAALAGACDITIASSASKFAFGEVKHGIPPTLAMAAVMNKVPQKALAWLIFSGAEVNPHEAITFGLVSKIFDDADFDRETDGFLAELASRPRLVLETIKKFMLNARDMTAEMQSEYAGTLLALVRS